MKAYSLDTPVQYLKGVGPRVAEVFKNLGVERVEDLLTLVPTRYARISFIKDINLDEEVRITGRIIDTYKKRTSIGQLFIVKLSDGTGTINCSFFNYSQKAIAKFEWNKLIEVEGKVSFWGRNLQLVNPTVNFSPSEVDTPLLPIYPLSEWLTHQYIRKIVRRALEIEIIETLPSYILQEENLLPRADAIHNLHFPATLELAYAARKRLEFEDLFWLEILIALRRKKIQTTGIKFKKRSELARKFYNLLGEEHRGFKLTKAQRMVCWEIFKDMESEQRMNRLLQGDVGSGKTIIAILSMLKAVESGYQSAFMAPTEVLAEQHYINLAQYLPRIGINLKLLIGSLSPSVKKEVQQEIQDGSAQVVVGTHALIEGEVNFKKLGFVVIDEQHKFGVMQRLKLIRKAGSPDVLVMTATPIPRSLSLTIYGDLDISIIDEMPPGVGKIETRWIYEDKIQEVWEFVKSELNKGKQCYIVYPIIEESEKLDLKAAQESYKNLRDGVFKNYKVGLLHGRLKNKEKTNVMENFRLGKLDVLVATTVIEVGIDIPNASCMVIEHAERFGLAQLHQLRGRLRRGVDKSYCILVSPKNLTELAKSRLETIEKEDNGFKLAEKDLELRGIGEFFGTRQHGLPEIRAANSLFDTRLIAHIRNIAFRIIDNDPELRTSDNKVIATTLHHRYRNKLKFLEAG